MKQQSTRLYVESNLYFESNRKKASSCCCSFVLVTLVFLFVANLTQDLASASTAVVEDSEDPTEYGMQAWFAYCADHDTSNDTLIKNMTSCQLTSANLKEELMSDCMKKFFPADIYGSGLSKIKKAQCGLSMGSFEKKKISEAYGKFLECTSSNKRNFDPCHGYVHNDPARCRHKVLMKFTKCLHKLGLLDFNS